MADLDTLLSRIDDPDLVDQLREAIDEQAENPNLVKNLRKTIDTVTGERDTLRREKQVAVLTEAGVPEKAHDRFLRDWKAERDSDEFNVDNVKSAADEFGYQLAAGGVTPEPSEDPAEVQRQQAEHARRQLQTEGVVESGIPPDLNTQIADLEQKVVSGGGRQAIEASMAAKHRLLQKAAQNV
jgi:hypothetical protein